MSETPENPLEMALPEDLDTLPLDAVELVDDEPKPKAKPRSTKTRPFEANFPPEAIRQIGDLKANLARKDKQIEQVMTAYREIKGETEKLRERIKKVERRKFEQSKGDFIARFVEVLDNLDRAIESIENNFDPDSVLQGIILVRSRLVQLLREEGLEKIFVGGQTFDPTYSEAAGMEEVASAEEDGVVLKELQRGYLLKGALLRAARVIVGRFSSSEEAAPAPTAPTAPTASSVASTVGPAPFEPPPQPTAPPVAEPNPLLDASDQILDELDNFISPIPDPVPAVDARPWPAASSEVPRPEAPVTNVPDVADLHAPAPLPPDSDDSLMQDLPAPIPDLLVPPEHFPEANQPSTSDTNPANRRPSGNPVLQDDLFEQDTEALEMELESLELEPDEPDFIE